jgi:hypothetical protein
MMRSHIVLMGTLHDGYVAVGVFKTRSVATLWVKQQKADGSELNYEIVPIVKPVLHGVETVAA